MFCQKSKRFVRNNKKSVLPQQNDKTLFYYDFKIPRIQNVPVAVISMV